MKYKAVKTRLGRYSEEFWTDFLRRLTKIGVATRAPVASELVAAEIRKSIREDLKPGVKPHDSGNDVKSIALETLEDLNGPIKKERDTQELAAVKEEIAVLEWALKDRQARLAELSGDRGALNQRVLEIEKARARAAEKLRRAS